MKVDLTEDEVTIIKLNEQLPINQVKKEMFSRHHVSSLTNVFVHFATAKHDLSMQGECMLSTKVHSEIRSENDIHDCYQILLKMCKEYRIDSYCVRFAYNRLVDKCISAVLRDVRKQIGNELMR